MEVTTMNTDKYWVEFYNYYGDFVKREFDTQKECIRFCENALGESDHIWDTNINGITEY
jgi:hypothetical protein